LHVYPIVFVSGLTIGSMINLKNSQIEKEK